MSDPSEAVGAEFDPPQSPLERGEHEKALEELAWAITASEGVFKLILARCNYTDLRKWMVQRLQELVSGEIRTLVLKESDQTLYTTTRNFLQEDVPVVLMVFGLEIVCDLDRLLSATNQVREEFRKNFPFPLVLWVNDQVMKKLVRLAPDFESWATTTEFAIAPDALIDGLRQRAEVLFTTILDSDTSQILSNDAIFGSGSHQELQAASQNLQNLRQDVDLSLQAILEFALGRDAHASGDIEAALRHYQQSLVFWQQEVEGQETRDSEIHPPLPPLSKGGSQNSNLSRGESQNLHLAVVLFHLGLCYFQQAEEHPAPGNQPELEEARARFQRCLDIFEAAHRPDLVAKFINPLGEVLQRLAAWDDLLRLAQKSLALQETYANSLRFAQAYGFLAEVALQQSRWEEAKQDAQRALAALGTVTEAERLYQGLYLLLLAESERHLGQQDTAVEHLQQARDIGPQDTPQQYIRILVALRSLYLEQKQYLKAFCVKKQQRSIEQQYGLRAFIGAGRIQPQRQAKLALTQVVETRDVASVGESVASEIVASGRQLDVERLIERIGRNDCKLIVIHGQSGVGKSSLVYGGLVPSLKQKKAIGTQDVLPVAVRVYTHWVEVLRKLLGEALEERGSAVGAGFTDNLAEKQTTELNPPASDSIAAILELLKETESRNLRTVLIFDQFEEFFFVCTEPAPRRQFFEFVGECLKIRLVKVILSLREDYLHYLLEGESLSSMKVIGNDILTKNVRYELGNFLPNDAKSIIQQLTERSSFH